MTDEIILNSTFDAHVHLRSGDMLRTVFPHTLASFAGCLAMPNLDPPITSWHMLDRYRREVAEATVVAGHSFFQCHFAAYFRPDYTGRDLERLRSSGAIAVKFYPASSAGPVITHNSKYGCDPSDPGIPTVLGIMEKLNLPLCVHAESFGYHEDREFEFIAIVRAWAHSFPDLKIIVEHMSDSTSYHILGITNVYATVTPHHLILTGDDVIGPPFQPHLNCCPTPKRPKDRDGLAWMITDSQFAHKVMLGTDSAPYPVSAKESAKSPPGIFNAPIALQLVADVFDRAGRLEKLQAFVSDNACRIYGLDLPAKPVKLVRRPFVVPDWHAGGVEGGPGCRYVHGPDRTVVPMFAGQTIPWSIEI